MKKHKGRLEDKVIIVAGAGTALEGVGNGKAAAVTFAREGAKVCCLDISEAAVNDTVAMIKDEGGEAVAVVGSILETDDIRRLIDTCLETYKKVDVLYNNVGIPGGGEIVNTDEDTWDRVVDVNAKGMFLTCKAVIPHMIESGGGAIINVSSIASHRPLPDVAYVASKGAVDSMTQYIAARYGRYNIRANVLLLGYIETPLASPAWEIEKIRQINLRQVPMRRFASPWEVASVAAFMASDDASYINGVVLPVDGGLITSV